MYVAHWICLTSFPLFLEAGDVDVSERSAVLVEDTVDFVLIRMLRR